MAIYIVIAFTFSGCFACLPLLVALRSEKRIAALIVPYIAVILCDAARNFLNYICYIEISPLNLMRSLPPENASKPFVLISWLVIFSAVILIFGLRKGVNHEIVYESKYKNISSSHVLFLWQCFTEEDGEWYAILGV